MWKCQKCSKPVYFAERRQSMGFDWHPWCLKCHECQKILNPGQHAEHKGVPYCHVPCYSALFGPRLFGHGSVVESHSSFGMRSKSFIRSELELRRKVSDYNDFLAKKDEKRLRIEEREVNNRLVLHGVLRLFWGVDSSIRLREFDDNRHFGANKRRERQRKARSLALSTVVDPEGLWSSSSSSEDENQDEINNENASKNNRVILRSNSEKSKISKKEEKIEEVEFRRRRHKSTETTDNFDNDTDSTDALNRTISGVNDPKIALLNSNNSNALNRSAEVSDIPALFKSHKENNDANIDDEGDKEEDEDNWSNKETNNNNNSEINVKKEENDREESSNANNVKDEKIVRGSGPRALRRRHGRKMSRVAIRRRSSINGHWYDRDTSVFTPPRGAVMSVHVSSLVCTSEVVRLVFSKYQVESDPEHYAIYVVKETGERRRVGDSELPLLLRVHLGPDESVAKLFLMDQRKTEEISHEVAQFLNFSYAECRAMVNMYYELEESEVELIRAKYKYIRRRIKDRMTQLTQNVRPSQHLESD